ncbi:unnamed protein product [Ectocarpus sp. 6 AP-2014]
MSGHKQAWSTRKKAPAVEKNGRAWLRKCFSAGEYAEAEPLYDRSQAIRENVLGPEHADVATTLSSRTGLLESQGNYAKAESLYERSQAIRERVLGPEHPDVATMLNNLARLLLSQGKYAEAEQLYERSEAIRDKTLDPDHPDVARSLNDRALLLDKKEQYTDAVPLLERALSIRMKKLGENHPDTASTQNSLDIVRRKVRAHLGRLVGHLHARSCQPYIGHCQRHDQDRAKLRQARFNRPIAGVSWPTCPASAVCVTRDGISLL